MASSKSKSNRFFTRKRLGIGLAVCFFIVVALGLLSYFWLPGYVKSELEEKLSQKINRPVTVQAIEFKPLTLELTVTAFHIGAKNPPDPAKNTLLSFDKLHVDLSIDSITQRALVISTITLEKPQFYLVRQQEDQYNITDILAAFEQKEEAPKPEEESGETLFSVSNIVMKDGHFELTDQFKNSQQVISDINFGIPFVSNFGRVGELWVEPHFSANVNDAPFSLDGKLLPFTNKREATLDIKLDDIDLTRIDEYVPLPKGLSLLSGYFDSDLLLKFVEGDEALQSVTLSGQVALKKLAYKNQAVEAPYTGAFDKLNVQVDADFMGIKPTQTGITLNNVALTRAGESKPVFSLPELALDNVQIDMAKKHVLLDTISLNQLGVSLQRAQDGSIDLTRLFASTGGGVSQPTSSSVNKQSVGKKVVSAIVAPPIPRRKPSQQEVAEALAQAKAKEAEATAAAEQPMDQPPAEVATTAPVTKKEDGQMLPVLSMLANNKNPWVTQINTIQLTDASIDFRDKTLKKAVPMKIHGLNLTINNLDINGVKPLELLLQAKVNKRGSINTSGTLAWAPLSTNLNIDLKKVDLVSLQGWGGDQLNALLTRGNISFKGKVDAKGEPLVVALNGTGRLSNFNIFDKQRRSDVLRWRNIGINGLKFVNEPLRVNINSLRLDRFYARVDLLPDGTLNLNKIVKQDQSNKSSAAKTKPAKKATKPAKQSMPVRIGKVIVNKSNVRFSDQFIKPSYRANLTELTGEIAPLQANKTGNIKLTGSVDNSAPLEIAGTIDPFSAELKLDIAAKASNIDLPTFSPYSGKYVGYAIERGKLSVDVHYQIEDNALKAKNEIFLDQLKLGDEIDSPDAPSLPLKLAVSLLKDRNGEINLKLPLKGSVDDPQFSIGDVLFDAFVNLIMKAITAPFALLGSALGDGQELSAIDFQPGHAKIETEAETRLKTLATALTDRPALKLEITGYADSKGDYVSLKKVLLDRMVKAKKLTEEAAEGEASGSMEDIQLDEEQYEEYLTMVYDEQTFEKPENMLGFTKSLPVPEMEVLILKHLEVSDEDYRKLAQQRANAAREWLINQGAVSNDRIFMLGEKVKSDEQVDTGQVQFKIK